MQDLEVEYRTTPSNTSAHAVPALPGGVWPVILTPFDKDRKIDWAAYERLIEWYIDNGASGLFASCLSSEVFYLSLQERKELIRRAVKQVGNRIPVVASGALGSSPFELIEQLKVLADAGSAALVLLTNQATAAEQDESAFRSCVDAILSDAPDIDLGLYECPVPYKRLLSPELVHDLAKTGRFVFLKETSCCPVDFALKVKAAQHTRLGIYAADNPTLLASLRSGARGYSGIAASGACAELSALCNLWNKDPKRAELLQHIIGPASVVLGTRYPASAKYFLRSVLGNATECRWMDSSQLTISDRDALDQLHHLLAEWNQRSSRKIRKMVLA